MGARTACKEICRGKPTNCGSDYMHRLWNGARRFGCPNGYSLAASVVGRRLLTGVRSSGTRRAPAVHVLLHNARRGESNDVELLHFMAKRLSRAHSWMRLRKQRRSLTKFNKSKLWLLGASGWLLPTRADRLFGGSKKSRRSFPTWLLEWVFSDPGITRKKVACCDACCRRMINRRGQLGFVQSVLLSGS